MIRWPAHHVAHDLLHRHHHHPPRDRRRRPALERLARLDSQRLVARRPHLVAHADGDPRRRRLADDGRSFADPFRASEPIVDLLHERAGSHPGARAAPGVPALSCCAASSRPRHTGSRSW